MWALRLTLLLAITFECRGQDAFFDIGTQIQMNGATEDGTTSNNRKICYDGTDVYYTSGSQIFVVGTATAVVDTQGPTIYSIACRCNVLVYSYVSGGDTFVVYYETDGSGITIDFDLGAVNQVAVELSPSHGLVIVGASRIWIYDQAPLTTAAETFTYDITTLDNLPRCIATFDNGGDRIVFVSFATNNNVQVITIPSGTASTSTVTVTDREVRKSGFVAEVSCVDIDQGNAQIYFLVVADGDSTDWTLDRYAISGWLTASQDETGKTVVQSGTNGDIQGNNNGLAVCGTDCQSTCSQATCSCPTTAPLCGFCIGGDSTCQCEDSGQTGCVYDDPTLETQCLVPEPHFDSYCIVDLPLAKRRKGGPIRVVGAAAASATIDVSRLAQTGRWNVATLPINTGYAGNTAAVYWDGFEAAVPSSGRGRRFGVYEAYISPTDPNENPEYIPCIATENSGFYNEFYTYTRSIGDSVTLVATMRSNLLQFMGNVRWYFTGFNPTTGNPLSLASINCDGQLMCTINNLDATDEGVYEAYRVNRRKRTWHPLFYLFIRGCPAGSFGPSCLGTCPTCDHGECDDLTGLCTCKAGWTGTNCDTPCTNADEIGQTCGYTCGEIFAGSSDCSGLSFCVPGKVGCNCYSGFEAPECVIGCGVGSCGPNCASTCNGGSLVDCNDRTCA